MEHANNEWCMLTKKVLQMLFIHLVWKGDEFCTPNEKRRVVQEGV